MENSISLLELNHNIQESLKKGFPESLWIIAEISELKINRNGHCYLELIEKDLINENIVARSRATIWAFTFKMIKPYFESVTSQELLPGLKILFKASIEFHEAYGLSLNITDIEPNYTLGDLAKKRAETIKRLENDGIINMNKELELPKVIQRIAIISSETAAGYQDFITQLNNNNFNFAFYTKLFPSVMQGVQAEESIINSLEKIYQYEELFDIAVLIRGGGSQADLNCFNNYLLASHISQFPLPVLTGIGHDKDESVTDIVAHTKLKTPTAVAEFIIQQNMVFENYIDGIGTSIYENVKDYISQQLNRLQHIKNMMSPITNNFLLKENHNLGQLKHFVYNTIKYSFTFHKNELRKIIFKTKFSAKENLLSHYQSINEINQKKECRNKNLSAIE